MYYLIPEFMCVYHWAVWTMVYLKVGFGGLTKGPELILFPVCPGGFGRHVKKVNGNQARERKKMTLYSVMSSDRCQGMFHQWKFEESSHIAV